jgi:cytochrome c oxidase subunit 1
MTITETRVEEAPADAAGTRPRPGNWFTSGDHKRIGTAYLIFALLFLLVGGVLGVVLRADISQSGTDILGARFARAFSEHATVSVFLFLAPAWVGLAAYVVPLQIGAARLAFPRVMLFSLWLYVFGGGVLIVSYMLGTPRVGAGLLGLASGSPIAAKSGGAGETTDLFVTGLMMVGLAAVLAAGCLATTILKLRVAGLTLRRVPMFTSATLVTSLGVIVATPMFLAGLALLYVDVHFGGRIFASSANGGDLVWRHTLWLFGRPELFLLTLPGLGAAADIVATHARRPFLDERPLRAVFGLFGIASLGALWAPHSAQRALVLPNPPALNAVLGALVGIVVLVLLGTLARGRPRAHVSVLFVAGFVVLLVFAAANAVIAAVAGVHGSAWTDGHVHVAVFGAPTLLLAGAIYHWAPKMFGRYLSNGTGGAVFLLLFGGFLLTGLGEYLLGYNGAAGHVREYASGDNLSTYSQLATVGGVLVALGAVALFADLLRVAAGKGAAAPADPYDGLTLEWATTSPPPPANFEAVPEVRSSYPALDLRAAAGAGTGGGR